MRGQALAAVPGSNALRAAGLFRTTPLIYSPALTSLLHDNQRPRSRPVFLKLDHLQQSGSFKDRGMAHLCHALKKQGVTHLISSSGGNAGLAVATIGALLSLSVSVIVPQSTQSVVIAKLQALGATVTVHGEQWHQADEHARALVESLSDTAAYISPYDHPLLWTGHSTLVDELAEQLPEAYRLWQQQQQESTTPTNGTDSFPEGTTVICSVGGGGLLSGILEGLDRHGAHHVQVLAVETRGAHCLAAAWQQQQHDQNAPPKPVRLSSMTSLATSLGAMQVTPAVLQRAHAYSRRAAGFQSVVCTDAQAVHACVQFTRHHYTLVEPACGAALAVAYSPDLRAQYLASSSYQGPVVIQVCGGSGVTIELLQQWEQQVGLPSTTNSAE
jgi:L-serine/L-threonine ammonia-lyase